MRTRTARMALMAGGWTLVGLLLGIQAWASGALRGAPIAWGRAFAIWLAWAWIWALLTPVALRCLEWMPLEAPRRGLAVLGHVFTGVTLATLNLALFAVVAPLVQATNVGPNWWATFSRLFGTTFLLNVPVYGLIIGAAHGARLAAAARARESRALRLEAQLAEARLAALRAQLEPHFLFNALNTVSVLMHEDVESADRVLLRLSQLLRRALDAPAGAEVELGQELEFLEAYLAVEKARFADRLVYTVDVAPELLGARVPSLILQPLVENAVRHGLARSPTPGRIEIAATRREDQLQLSVTDSGPGLAEGAPEGIGLSNTRSRLELLYGPRHSLVLAPGPAGGLSVSVAIPLRIGPVV